MGNCYKNIFESIFLGAHTIQGTKIHLDAALEEFRKFRIKDENFKYYGG